MNSFLLKLFLTAKSQMDRREAQGLAEYAMAFSLIALGTVAGQSAIAHQVNQTFIAITSTITTHVGL